MAVPFSDLEIIEEEIEEYYNKYGERIHFPEMYAIVYNKYGEEILHPCPELVVEEEEENDTI